MENLLLNGSIGFGLVLVVMREQVQSFFRGFIVSIINNTKKGRFYLMRNRNTDNLFLVRVIDERIFRHPGCHVEHFFSGLKENISWNVYKDYTFIPLLEELQESLLLIKNKGQENRVSISDDGIIIVYNTPDETHRMKT